MNTSVDKRLIRRAAVVTISRIALLGFWFLAIAWVYRTLGNSNEGIEQAGVLAFSLAAIKMFTTALGDPLDMDVVRRVPTLIEREPRRALDVWRGAQQIRIAFASVILGVAVLLATPISDLVFHAPHWSSAIRLMAIAIALELMFRGHLSDYQSRERFDRFLALELLLQSLRVLAVAGLIAGDFLRVESFLAAYAGATGLTVLTALIWGGADRRALWKVSPSEISASLRYIRWIAPAMVVSALVERLDIFLLTTLKGPDESGLYGALLPIILVPEVVIGFAVGVLQPRIADFHAKGMLRQFWFQVSCLAVPLAAVGAGFVWLFAEQIIRFSIGEAYAESADVLRVLFSAVMIWFAIAPVALSFVVMVLPRATLALTLIQATLALSIGWVLIDSHGTMGAAIMVLIMRAVTGSMIVAAAVWLLSRPAPSAPVTP